MRSTPVYRILFIAVIALALQIGGGLTAYAQTTVGGHIGISIPWVTREGGQTTSIADSYTIGVPFGVTIKGQGRVFVDFEFVPAVNQSPHANTLTIDPGVLFTLGKGFTGGLRALFDIPSSRVGFVPLLNKSWPLHNQKGFFKTFFVEDDLPVKFSRPPGGPATNSFTFATQTGFGF